MNEQALTPALLTSPHPLFLFLHTLTTFFLIQLHSIAMLTHFSAPIALYLLSMPLKTATPRLPGPLLVVAPIHPMQQIHLIHVILSYLILSYFVHYLNSGKKKQKNKNKKQRPST